MKFGGADGAKQFEFIRAYTIYSRIATAEQAAKRKNNFLYSGFHLIYGTSRGFVSCGHCDYSPGEHIILVNTTTVIFYFAFRGIDGNTLNPIFPNMEYCLHQECGSLII